MRFATLLVCFLILSTHHHDARAADAQASFAQQVRDAENAFAKSMADRDLQAFTALLAVDAIFFGDKVLKGKAAVVAGWAPFFEGAVAPFSWSSESVEVLESGALAYSSGPILDKQGQRVGTFNSVWRRESDGSWKVVFDKGCNACRCK